MMKTILAVLLASTALTAPAHALEILNLNVFDQLQGKWEAEFRAKRMEALAQYIGEAKPDIIVFEEARGILLGDQGGGSDSADARRIKDAYPHRTYLHEMTGADDGSFGYWVGAKRKPRKWIKEGFAFPGGVSRKVLGGIWDKAYGNECLGIIGLHLSYQKSEVRQKEAQWILDFVKKHEKDCKHWLVMGDFNANEKTAEMNILFEGGLHPLPGQDKPTVGAYNPIRRIYGENIPSETIDWALGWNLEGKAEVVLEKPFHDLWISDHAGILVTPAK
jgi:endonuclease/exonuclease/phosphatase family metal-dependent hydrolase